MTWHAPHASHGRVVAIIARYGAARLSTSEILVVPVPAAGRPDDDEYYLPGAMVASGEHADRTLVRSIRATLGFDVTVLKLIGTLGDTLSTPGEYAQEQAWLYECDVADPAVYERHGIEATSTSAATAAVWVPVSAFASEEAALLPHGALAVILGL